MTTVTVNETRYTVDVSGAAPTVVTTSDPEVIEVEISAHPSLADHNTLGLATQAELDAHAATSHGTAHPDLAAHDTLGLATQTELDNHDHSGIYEPAGTVATHEADTTSVHGITNTEDLIRRAGALTAGSILFASGGNEAQQDNANLFWDDANNRLGIGTSSPATRFVVREDVAGVSVGMRLENRTVGVNRGVKLQFVGGTTPVEVATLVAAFEGAGETTSYFAFQTRSGGTTEKMRLTSAGALGLASGGIIPSAHLHVVSGSATEITQILQGAASQSANLTEWRTSAGTPIAAVGPAGKGSFGDSFTTSNATRALNLVSTDAVMRILRVSASIDSAAPAVELIHRLTADGADQRFWDVFIDSTGLKFRDRQAGNLTPITIQHGAQTNSAVITTVGHLELLRNVYARKGLSTEVVAGSGGPGGEAGLTIGGDVHLYRSAADTLKTDDSFVIGGSLTLTGQAVSFGAADSAGAGFRTVRVPN